MRVDRLGTTFSLCVACETLPVHLPLHEDLFLLDISLLPLDSLVLLPAMPLPPSAYSAFPVERTAAPPDAWDDWEEVRFARQLMKLANRGNG